MEYKCYTQEYYINIILIRDKDKILKKATKKKNPHKQKQKSYFKMDKISEQAHYKEKNTGKK